MRPRSCPARRSSCFCDSAGIHCGCSITARYMSTTHRAPSGPVRAIVGRNQLSADDRNSRPLFVLGPAADERHAVGGEVHPVDEVVDRLADEEVAGEGGARTGRRGRSDPARGGEAVGRSRVVEAGERAAEREHRGGAGPRTRVVRRGGQVRVAGQVAVVQRMTCHAGVELLQPNQFPQSSRHLAVLRLAGRQLDLAGVRPEAEVPAADVERLAGGDRRDDTRRCRRWRSRPSCRGPRRAR